MGSNDRIICLIGRSGSGKTTVAKILEKEYDFNIIHSYTTREPREPNEWGHTFIPMKRVTNHPYSIGGVMQETGEVVAETYFNNNWYWATKEQYRGKGDSIYVIDPRGVEHLRNSNTEAEIMAIYLQVDRQEAFNRMLARDKISNPESEKYQKVVERLQHDDHAFSIVRADWIIDTNLINAEQVAKVISETILRKG